MSMESAVNLMRALCFSGGIAEIGEFGWKEFFKAVFIDRLHIGFLGRNHPFAQFRPDRLVHELHTLTLSAGNNVIEFLGGTFTNDGGNGGSAASRT